MFKIIFTSDYEIHGNGEGSPSKLMVEPTSRMLKLFDEYGAKLTILADIAEILKFKEYKEQTGRDKFFYDQILQQLIHAIKTDHDVQLHIHSSYFKSVYDKGSWKQNYSEYDLTRLEEKRLNEIIKLGKSYLESILKPVNTDYECYVFRAANWSMQPSKDIVNALINNGISIDTSVFKFGKRDELVKFDYSAANSDLIPWPASSDDICQYDPTGKLFEIPIYCEKKSIWTFITLNRIYRVLVGLMHRLGKNEIQSRKQEIKNISPKFNKKQILINKINLFFKKNAWKMDFNQCTGKQLIKGLLNAEKQYGQFTYNLPFVLIGHSKIFTRSNEKSLRSFLEFIVDNNDRFSFGTFKDINLEKFNVRKN